MLPYLNIRGLQISNVPLSASGDFILTAILWSRSVKGKLIAVSNPFPHCVRLHSKSSYYCSLNDVPTVQIVTQRWMTRWPMNSQLPRLWPISDTIQPYDFKGTTSIILQIQDYGLLECSTVQFMDSRLEQDHKLDSDRRIWSLTL